VQPTFETSSLFGHLATRFGSHPENLATEALNYILGRSDEARDALVRFARLTVPALEGELRFRTQDFLSDDGAIPDLVGVGKGGATPLVIEAKFDAGLTDNQPVTYLRRLPPASVPLSCTAAPVPPW
jgi:hypothetical protein